MSPELAARFEREALPYRGQLMRTALQLTRHRQEAEDLVQDAITRACAGFHRFNTGTNLRAWLHRILLNTFINGYRKRQRDPVLCTISADQVSAFATPSAEECVLSSLPPGELVQALRELPAGFREVVYLIDVEGFSYRETAGIMNTPLGTVMSRLHRARTSLREQLIASSAAGLFEPLEQRERMGKLRQEVSHVERDNGDYRGPGDSRYRLGRFPHDYQPESSAKAAVRSRI